MATTSKLINHLEEKTLMNKIIFIFSWRRFFMTGYRPKACYQLVFDKACLQCHNGA